MITIAWDVDDLLNDLMRAWLESAWRPAHPECRLSYEDLVENPPSRLLGVETGAYLASLDAFRLSGAYEALAPDAEVMAWFEACGARYRHVALTAAPMSAAPVSAAWVMRHFGRWIRSFHVLPSPRPDAPVPAYDADKGEFLRFLGHVDLFLDDSPANVAAARAAGVESRLVARPWSPQGRPLSHLLADMAA